MAIEEAVNTRLLAVSAVTALVGSGTAARIYPLVIPQDAQRPAISYQKISSPKTISHSGDSNLSRSRFQFTCQAETYTSVKALATAVRNAFIGYRGTISGVRIDGGLVEDDTDGDIEIQSNEVLPFVRLDIVLWHSE
jgi:hypothetical protein